MTFYVSNTRPNELKTLIQKLPTRKQVKDSNLDLFKDWKCPACSTQDETLEQT
jgi:protein-disulfide isomerase